MVAVLPMVPVAGSLQYPIVLRAVMALHAISVVSLATWPRIVLMLPRGTCGHASSVISQATLPVTAPICLVVEPEIALATAVVNPATLPVTAPSVVAEGLEHATTVASLATSLETVRYLEAAVAEA